VINMLQTRRTIMASGYIASVIFTVFPVAAQTPQHGLKTGYVATMFTGEILPGQLDNFKQLVTRLVSAVAEEPGTLVYEISLRPDQKTYDSLEVYRNSEAVVAHAKHVRAEFGKELGKVRNAGSFVVFGSPDAQAKKALSGLNPVYESPIDGFTR
jgi:quinol monooxygenase YgiN